MNGNAMPPGAQPNFAIPQTGNPANTARQQAEHLRRLQQGAVANPAAFGQIPFQHQMAHVPNPQLQQLQLQQAQMRVPQAQMIPGQHIIQHAANPNVQIPVANGPQGSIPLFQLYVLSLMRSQQSNVITKVRRVFESFECVVSWG
jgi:hypothetical protein